MNLHIFAYIFDEFAYIYLHIYCIYLHVSERKQICISSTFSTIHRNSSMGFPFCEVTMDVRIKPAERKSGQITKIKINREVV